MTCRLEFIPVDHRFVCWRTDGAFIVVLGYWKTIALFNRGD
jgi:hypothetical protein